MPQAVVSDTGPIITLEKLPDGFALLRKLYDKILLPEEVLEELAEGFETPSSYLEHFELSDFIQIEEVQIPKSDKEIEALDRGEQAAIALAEARGLGLLIEEKMGRTVAKNRGLHYSGIAGQVLKALRDQVIDASEAERMLRDLYRVNRINRRLLGALLEAVKAQTS